MKLNRKLQKKILEFLGEDYPSYREIEAFYTSKIINHKTEKIFYFNMFYLQEHNLIELTTGVTGINIPPKIYTAKITNKGIDFLENDGGLSAILNTVTIKFDTEDIRKLLSKEIYKSNLAPKIKSSMSDTINNAPADILKILYTNLVNLALDKVPNVYHQLQTWLLPPS